MQILIAHQSAITRGRLQKRLHDHGGISVVHTATDLSQTYDFAEHHHPDCVVMAASMADCDEFELLASLLDILNIGCVLLTSPEPPIGARSNTRAAPGLQVLPESAADTALVQAIRQTKRHRPARRPVQRPSPQHTFGANRLILIGASTGGVDALLSVIRHFDKTSPPVLIVQHTGSRFAQSLVRLLDSATEAAVQCITEPTPVKAGNIYMAPDGETHLQVENKAQAMASLSHAPAMSGHRPSVDMLFKSAVPVASKVAAALLTGMGRDGATGLKALHDAGAHTIAQDEATSVVYGMPRVAMETGAVVEQLPIDAIGPALLRASQARNYA